MPQDVDSTCPSCEADIQAMATYNEYDNNIERHLMCPKCGAIWSETFTLANRCIIKRGTIK